MFYRCTRFQPDSICFETCASRDLAQIFRTIGIYALPHAQLPAHRRAASSVVPGDSGCIWVVSASRKCLPPPKRVQCLCTFSPHHTNRISPQGNTQWQIWWRAFGQILQSCNVNHFLSRSLWIPWLHTVRFPVSLGHFRFNAVVF